MMVIERVIVPLLGDFLATLLALILPLRSVVDFVRAILGPITIARAVLPIGARPQTVVAGANPFARPPFTRTMVGGTRNAIALTGALTMTGRWMILQKLGRRAAKAIFARLACPLESGCPFAAGGQIEKVAQLAIGRPRAFKATSGFKPSCVKPPRFSGAVEIAARVRARHGRRAIK
ncbi:MAG: hypothetical protein K8T25_11475 [Planctomycetia bacterium]|nr:hypothetical protein [Planctomycetia bacterium]